ncbi:glycine cleavage system T protein [Pneumocystis jirovecii RU7]|uniref:Aminomethyltransferase n=1 Tax=Pneumocystis jirovecii (strain RU7) TaxID=1408657 RepID=A0A0W4ZCU4_PNEJ7|nr:glycine cleavage system T protein [Pneumocystis jirovecii RU7]KTW26235.1 glycine cleavage system T protein [Pneumocystis jirovecii RU7]
MHHLTHSIIPLRFLRFSCVFSPFFKRYISLNRHHKTPLYDLHIEYGAKMTEFAGFWMPLFYADQSILESHLHVRSKAAVFDVSHMIFRVSGSQAAPFLESLTPSDIQQLPLGTSVLSVLLNTDGGIEDDLMVYRHEDNVFYLVTNAATRSKNIKYFADHLCAWDNTHVKVEERTEAALLALQGPLSASILQTHTHYDLSTVKFGGFVSAKVAGVDTYVSRTGYTGEDGFEISIPSKHAVSVLRAFLRTSDALRLAGLGARDSLRLEAGMCLYGTDIDHMVTPVEASLSWIIGKRRREEGGFPGDLRILKQLREGVQHKRVGLVVKGAPARHGASILSADGSEKIGHVTSGCPSPSLGKNIAMGYIKTGYHKKDTQVTVDVRGKPRNALVSKIPWITTKYYR